MSAVPRDAVSSGGKWHWPWQWGVAALVTVALRLALLDSFGILQTEDSGGYIGYAEGLFAHGGIWQVIANRALPSGFRALGYPAFLTTTMELAGADWLILAVGLQILLGLGALWGLYRLGLALGMQRGYAALSAALFMCSQAAIYDLAILTDAMAAHSLIIALCWMVVPLLKKGRIGAWSMLAGGLGMAFSIMMRDATLYLVPALMLGLLIVMYARVNWKRIAYLQICLLLPVLVFWQGYTFWMVGKPGRQQPTSVGQFVYLLHPLDIEYRGYKVLTEPLLREAFEATSGSYTYEHAMHINSYLEVTHKLGEWQRLALAKKAYAHAWREAPDQMALEVLRELRLKYMALLANPSMPFREYPILAGLSERTPRKDQGIATVGIEMAFRMFSILVFVGCVVGVPALLLRRSWRASSKYRLEGLVFCWLVFVSMVGMYAMIHMEWRYSLPAQAFAVMSGMAMLAEIAGHLRQRFSSKFD